MEYMPADLARTLVGMASGTSSEICGFIFDDWTLTTVKNIAKDHEHTFEMGMDAILEAINLGALSGREILGVYHSHPGGSRIPSRTDLIGWPQFIDGSFARYWIISHQIVREFQIITEGEARASKLVHYVNIGVKSGPQEGVDQSVSEGGS